MLGEQQRPQAANTGAPDTEPPPFLPAIKVNPVKLSLSDSAVTGTTVAIFSVSTSDGSPFSGTLEASPAGTVAVAGTTRLVLARSLSSADDGLQQWGVTATQNGVSVSGFFQVQVTANAPPSPPPEPIPPQSAGPHFVIGEDDRIKLAPPSELDSRGNLVGRIRELLPLVRRAADELAAHVSSNAFPEFARNVTDYREAGAADEDVIAWGLVFGLGVVLENSAEAAKRKIEDRLLPSLEDIAQSALDSLLTLHGPLILATAEGRELQEQADRLRMTREEQLSLRGDAEWLAVELARSPDVIEPEAADTVGKAVLAIGEGRFAERGTVFGIATVRNVAITLVSGAALAALVPVGAMVGGVFGGIAGASLAWMGGKTLEKTNIFLAATAALAEKFDQSLQSSETKLAQRLTSLAPFRRFVTVNEEALRRIGTDTPRLHWMLPYIDFIGQITDAEKSALASDNLSADDRSGVQSVRFDYSEHDGYITVGEGAAAFTLRFSKRSAGQIQFIKARENTEIARVKGVTVGEMIEFDQLPHTSTRYDLGIGDHFIVKNENGYYMQGHIIGIKDDTRGADTDEVCFEYRIYSETRPGFRAL